MRPQEYRGSSSSGRMETTIAFQLKKIAIFYRESYILVVPD
jgi:hypothetical protein